MSQLTLNCLQEANLSGKPYARNGTEDRYQSLGGLGVFHWKRKKSMQQIIVNPGGGKTPGITWTNKKKENSEEYNQSYYNQHI